MGTCKHCKFWYSPDKSEGGYQNIGKCRIRAPGFVPNMGAVGAWPETKEDAGCHEFVAPDDLDSEFIQRSRHRELIQKEKKLEQLEQKEKKLEQKEKSLRRRLKEVTDLKIQLSEAQADRPSPEMKEDQEGWVSVLYTLDNGTTLAMEKHESSSAMNVWTFTAGKQASVFSGPDALIKALFQLGEVSLNGEHVERKPGRFQALITSGGIRFDVHVPGV